MRTTLTTFMTLDGVYQAPGAPDEDTSGGFTHGGWTVPYGDDDFGAFVASLYDRVDGFLLGRRTYDIFAAYWPKFPDQEDPIASRLNTLPKYVASTTLTSADWAGTEILSGDVPDQVAELKRQEGHDLLIHGSGVLARTLLAHGLIDTLHLLTFPVVLGTGKRLFHPDAMPSRFRLTDSRTTGAGVVIASYELDGRPEYGTYTA